MVRLAEGSPFNALDAQRQGPVARRHRRRARIQLSQGMAGRARARALGPQGRDATRFRTPWSARLVGARGDHPRHRGGRPAHRAPAQGPVRHPGQDAQGKAHRGPPVVGRAHARTSSARPWAWPRPVRPRARDLSRWPTGRPSSASAVRTRTRSRPSTRPARTYPGSRVFSDIGCYTLGALPPYNADRDLRLHGREHRHGQGRLGRGDPPRRRRHRRFDVRPLRDHAAPRRRGRRTRT